MLSVVSLSHVAISLVAVVAGFVVAAGLLNSTVSRGWTILFLATTALTSLTGFLFPFARLLPSHVIAILSLALLVVALFALQRKRLSGYWRAVYVVTALLSLYLNVLVLVIQAFMKVPALTALSPTQTEPAFVVLQALVLVLFVLLTIFATIRFRSPALA